MGSSKRVLPGRWQPGPPPLLLAAHCHACGETSFPPRPRCPECWAQTEVVTLPARGTLYTFTTVHRADRAPLVLGYADFGDVRVLGPLTGAAPKIGAPVLVTETSTGGGSRGYAFCVSEP
jgi:uncharacterized OB-fold protein